MTETRKSFTSRGVAASVLREMAYQREEFGRRLVAARERRRWSQERAASEAHVSTRQWVRWEAGRAMPYHSTLEKLATALRVDVSDLTGETEPAPLGLGSASAGQLEERLSALEHKIDHLTEIAETFIASFSEVLIGGEAEQLLEPFLELAQTPRQEDHRAAGSRARRKQARA